MRDALPVRTTLDIEDDVLLAAKELAAATNSTAGKVISDLARKGLYRGEPGETVRNGVPLFPRRGPGAPVLTMALVNELRDDP